MMENELQVDGQATFFVIYLGEGEEGSINYFENTIPVEGTIDCGGCQPDMVVQVMTGLHSRDIEIKEDEDGENRVMDVELVVDFDIKVYGQEQLELLERNAALYRSQRNLFIPRQIQYTRFYDTLYQYFILLLRLAVNAQISRYIPYLQRRIIPCRYLP